MTKSFLAIRHVAFEDLGAFEAPLKAAGYTLCYVDMGVGTRCVGYASGLASLGVPLHITEKLLNHVSGSFGGIVGVYQCYSYAEEMGEAVTAWENYLTKLSG